MHFNVFLRSNISRYFSSCQTEKSEHNTTTGGGQRTRELHDDFVGESGQIDTNQSTYKSSLCRSQRLDVRTWYRSEMVSRVARYVVHIYTLNNLLFCRFKLNTKRFISILLLCLFKRFGQVDRILVDYAWNCLIRRTNKRNCALISIMKRILTISRIIDNYFWDYFKAIHISDVFVGFHNNLENNRTLNIHEVERLT